MDGSWRLVVAVPNTEHLELGASVAIDGVCLTAVAVHEDEVAFDVIAETMDRSTIGDRKAGDEVNVERALRFGDEVGGHLVSGHVFDTGRIGDITRTGETCDLRIEASKPPCATFSKRGTSPSPAFH